MFAFRSPAALALALLLGAMLPAKAEDDGTSRNLMLIVDA